MQNGFNATGIDPTDYQMRVNARLGYGFSFVNTGLFTRYGLGVNWKPKLRACRKNA